ncbi:putative protease Do-like 14 isoform X3 [Oryza glaberrima]|uniref:putative protease Do-like 14 isoform X2 n=1 Tax=Oryza glaberrima TaxID=4538 RepID=UPI00224BE987|nr:putative protease Do-like 14 isoform X2 [Oryza glaberrima]XP_052165251.1 putative protease Do-like 14 isoform X3 [Oryza glaberrima]
MAAQESPPPFAAAAAATRASGDMASPPSPGEGGQSHTSERNPEKIQDQLAASSSSSAAAAKKRKSSETTTAGSTTLASRPLPPRYPPYPTLPPGTRPTRKYLDSVLDWAKERRRIAKLSKKAQCKDIPTLRDLPMDPITADAVVTSQDKAMVLRVARSVVSVSSTMPDGGGLISRCTGVVIGWDGANKRAKILTAASVVCDFNGELHNPALKLSVSMPNNTTTEGRLLFYNVHYGIALLEVMGDYKLEVPSFGSGTNYGQVIFALGRGENMSLMVSHGTISWTDYPVLLRNHNMFLSCDIPEGGSGGPVVDHDGNMIGIAFEENPGPVVISIKTIMTCMEMWDQFSRVARPLLGMQLKSVELLDVSIQEELCRDYNITSGFIVSQVLIDSTAEKLGIRRGDVIDFQDIDCSTLSQLEDHLLSLGWGYLKGMHLTADLKVEVHNLFDSYRESITFPVQFTDASKQVN